VGKLVACSLKRFEKERQPLRILINSINFSPEPISTGKYAGEMAEWLAQRGHEVRVVTTAPHYPQWRISPGYSAWKFSRDTGTQRVESAGSLEVYRCPVWVPRAPRGWKRIAYLGSFSLSSWPAMLRQIPWCPNVVLLVEPTLMCSPQVLCVSRFSGAVAWLHVQDFEVDVAFQLKHFSSVQLKRWIHWFERAALRRFDKVSSISDRMVERLSAKGVDPSRTSLFPNWVDASLIYPLPNASALRKDLNIPNGTTVALYSGNMGTKQGLGLLAETAERLRSRPDILFCFCGDGPYRETLTRKTVGFENVQLLPLQPFDKLNELLNAADIHLLPQVAGAEDLVMPSKLTGMMASGRAVVATAHADTQIYKVLQGKGLVCPPGNSESFAAAVVQLAENPALRLEMGLAARKHALANMNRDEILASFELSLMEACGRAVEFRQREASSAT
jgi:colanic acid biosynthesis glycosyl transferase WcaI